MRAIKSGMFPHFVRWLRRGFLLCIALALASCGGGDSQGTGTNQAKMMAKAAVVTSSVSVTGITKVSETRISRTVYDYVFQVTVKNNGSGPQSGVKATLTGVGTGTTIIDGTVQVGDLAAGASVTPQDTITLRQDRTYPFNSAALIWQVTASSSITTTVIDSIGGLATSADGKVTIVAPAGAVATSTSIIIGPSGDNAGQIDTLYQVTGQGGTDLTFQQPVTIKIKYDPATIPLGNNEADLQIGLLDPFDSWEILTDSSVDTVNKVITATTTHFSKVGILSASNVAGTAPKLGFPLLARDPFTAIINSVFDHSMKAAYCEDDKVQAYSGDIGVIKSIPSSCITYTQNIKTCGNNKTQQILCDFSTGGNPVTYKNGNADTTSISYDGHPGYDYRTTDQTSVDGIAGHIPVLAAAGGTAHIVGNWIWGTVWINHGNGYTTHYLHLYKSSIIEGQAVKQGDQIGVAGKTAPFAIGPHLHFEVKRNWIAIDPYSSNLWAAASPVASHLNDTGITASQCYQAGSDTLVSCNSAGAIALNNAQDGMVGRDANVATNSNTDGKLGFSFANVTGGCVQDNVTGLMWENKSTDGGLRDWNKTYTNYSATYDPSLLYGTSTDASGFVTAVNATNLCGYSDWRLPTADELQTIVDYGVAYGVAYPDPFVDATWFPNTKRNVFWSASPSVGNSYSAWFVNFGYGLVSYSGRSYSVYVRLVRAGPQPIPSLQRYAYSNGGQEVMDNQTKLIWRRCAEGMSWNGTTCTGTASTFTHEAALTQASTQASITGIVWRLPNIKELSSIADKSLSNLAIDSAAFPATPARLFWSASPLVGSSNDAWLVNFDNGYVGSNGRDVSYYVRLVRAGQ